MNRWIVWAVCLLNVGLVGYMGWRMFGSNSLSRPRVFHVDTNIESQDIYGESLAALELLESSAESSPEEWTKAFGVHPVVTPENWSERIEQNFLQMRAMVESNSSTLKRILGRESLFLCFREVDKASVLLLENWMDVANDDNLSPLERQRAIVLIFRLMLKGRIEEMISPVEQEKLAKILGQTANFVTLTPLIFEGWGLLYRNGQSEFACEILSIGELRDLAARFDFDDSVRREYVKLFDIVLPEYGWTDLRPYFFKGPISVREAVSAHIRKLNGSAVFEGMQSISFADPSSEFLRLNLLEVIGR